MKWHVSDWKRKNNVRDRKTQVQVDDKNTDKAKYTDRNSSVWVLKSENGIQQFYPLNFIICKTID